MMKKSNASAKRSKRNAPCSCGSGKKYKYCCMRKKRSRRQTRNASQGSPELGRLSRLGRVQEHIDEAQIHIERYDKILAASEALEAHRADFYEMMEDEWAAGERAHDLFSEERFVPMRYTADDVHRAFEAVGYPLWYQDKPDDKESETIAAAILHLAGDTAQRMDLAQRLMISLPEYVSAGRYMDAWLVQFSAMQTTEAPNYVNPFLFEMFNYGFSEWSRQIKNQQETALRELGIDPSEFAKMDVEKAESWLRVQLDDPSKMDRLNEYYETHTMIHDQFKSTANELGRGALLLVERDDAVDFYLPPQEVDPWEALLNERLEPIDARIRQAIEQKGWRNRDLLNEMNEILVRVAQEMIPVIFVPERIEQLQSDLRRYRRRLEKAGEREAAVYAHAALISLEHPDPLASNRFLIGICYVSLRLRVMEWGEQALARAEGDGSQDRGEVSE
ncbi:MAG: SEC-C domain-containing protein [Chloroflexi bacterium]|nr:SEC-C domain-containing protein [Chloroflexota bacterium]